MVSFQLNGRPYEAEHRSAASFAAAVARKERKEPTSALVTQLAVGLARLAPNDKLELSLPKVDVLLGLAKSDTLELVAPSAPKPRVHLSTHKPPEMSADVQDELALLSSLDVTTTRDRTTHHLKNDANHYKDGVAFAHQRRYSLAKTFNEAPEHHLITGYGREAAKLNVEPDVPQRGLRMQNATSTSYMRDASFQADPIYNALLAQDKTDATGGIKMLVNSDRVEEKLRALIFPVAEKYTFTKGTAFANGLHALVIKPVPKGDNLLQLMRSIGVAPSAFAAERLLAPKADIAKDPTVDNVRALSALQTRPSLEKLKGDEPMADAAYRMVSGLDVRGAEQDPLVAEALRAIGTMLDAMAANAGDPSKVSQHFSFMLEEMYIVLARTKPYSPKELEKIQRDVFAKRCPKLADFLQTTHIAANGMDALSTAMLAAFETHKIKQLGTIQERENYFELVEVMRSGKMESLQGPIVTVPLNSSMPGRAIDKKAVEKAVRDRLKTEANVTLILDISVERNENEVEEMLLPLRDLIDSGQLNVTLCKSYQKYATLGTGKIMAGSIAMINNGKAPWLTAMKTAEALTPNVTGHDEMQLLGHMLRTAHTSEIALIQDAAKKAALVGTHVWPPSQPSNATVLGLPFVGIDPYLFGETEDSLTYVPNAEDTLRKLDAEARDSFSFMRTSFLNAGSIYRMTVGHERLETLVERYFAAGHFDLNRKKPSRGERELHLKALALVCSPGGEKDSGFDAAVKLLGGKDVPAKETIAFLRTNRVHVEASYYYALRLGKSDAQDQAALTKFLVAHAEKLTPETRDALFQDWLGNIAATPTLDDLVPLFAMAPLIPPHQRVAFLQKVDLKALGEHAPEVFARLTADIEAPELFDVLERIVGVDAPRARLLFDLLSAQGPTFVVTQGLHDPTPSKPEVWTIDYRHVLEEIGAKL